MTPAPEESTQESSPESTPDIEELQAEIEKTRQALGETVDALSAKTDLKARVGAKVDEVRGRVHDAATDDQGDLKPVVPAGAAAVALLAGGIVVLLVWRKRRW